MQRLGFGMWKPADKYRFSGVTIEIFGLLSSAQMENSSSLGVGITQRASGTSRLERRFNGFPDMKSSYTQSPSAQTAAKF
jgi:hypothetical protein